MHLTKLSFLDAFSWKSEGEELFKNYPNTNKSAVQKYNTSNQGKRFKSGYKLSNS